MATRNPRTLPLYRYRPLSTPQELDWVCKSISESWLYWGSPLDFNDPFDCQPAFIFEGSRAERRALARKSADFVHQNEPRASRRRAARQSLVIPDEWIVSTMKASTTHELRRYGVVCLSSKNDHILMWAHYASNHSGICLGYQPSLKAIDLACAFEVHYHESRPIINLVHSVVEQGLFDTLLIKSNQWSYESEWRMLERRINNRQRPYPPDALAYVIFGYKTGIDDQARILAAIDSSGSRPKVFKAEIDEQEFQLNIRPFSL